MYHCQVYLPLPVIQLTVEDWNVIVILMGYCIRWVAISVAFTLNFIAFGPHKSSAEIYRFTSQDGVIHFTNVPTDPRFRRMTEVRSETDIQSTIVDTAREYNVDPELIRAVIKVESDFDPKAVSKAGAIGLMQLMPATASTLRVHDPFNPHENIKGGVKHLSHLLYQFDGNLTLALAAYHAGETRVKRYGSVPPIPQTQRYIKKVLAVYQDYRSK